MEHRHTNESKENNKGLATQSLVGRVVVVLSIMRNYCRALRIFKNIHYLDPSPEMLIYDGSLNQFLVGAGEKQIESRDF